MCLREVRRRCDYLDSLNLAKPLAMTNEKAISILEAHRAVIQREGFDSYYLWKQQALSFIRRFLGKDSEEYEMLEKITPPPQSQHYKSDLKAYGQIIQRPVELSISTISAVGIKREYHNFLCRFSDKEIIGGILAAITIIFAFGMWVDKWFFGHHITNP